MNGHEFELELDEYVDGTLPPEQVAAVEAHLLECARCRATVADFSVIRGAARTLEPQMPAAHVWMRIADAVELEQRRRPWWRLATGGFAWKPLAAVTVMLTLLLGGSWMAWRDASTHAGGASARITATASPTIAGGAAANPAPIDAEVQLAEQHYTTAIGDLEKVTQTEGGSLDPDTVKVVQANLAVLDQAIGQSRAALQSQPASAVAQESLFDALRSKVQLLQDTVALINEMRKGNQEGAARIMSGMNQ